MNQTSQFIFNLYHYLLNIRDTLEYTIDREHQGKLFEARKAVLLSVKDENSALGNFLKNNPKQKEELFQPLVDAIEEIYGEGSTILSLHDDKVRVDHTQNIKILEFVVNYSEQVRSIIYGYLNYAKQNNLEETDIVELVDLDEKFYRVLLPMIGLNDFKKSFFEFQKVMAESNGKPTPQSNFIVQNEILKISGLIRFVKEKHRCIDNETLDLLDKVNALIEMTEGRRERRDNKSFEVLFSEVHQELNGLVGKREPIWKGRFQSVLNTVLALQKEKTNEGGQA